MEDIRGQSLPIQTETSLNTRDVLFLFRDKIRFIWVWKRQAMGPVHPHVDTLSEKYFRLEGPQMRLTNRGHVGHSAVVSWVKTEIVSPLTWPQGEPTG